MKTKDEALHKALKVLNCLNNDRVYETAWVKGAINACEEALEQQEIGDAEIKQMLNDIEWYQMLVKELESELEAITQHQILEAISNDVAKQQKDKQFYQSSLVDIVEQPTQGMKAVSYPKDNKWIDMVEQPAQEPVAEVDFSLEYDCALVIDRSKVTDGQKLYTHPAPSWQGLSDEEIFVIIYNNLKTWNTFVGISKFIDVIEQTLKEKNHG